VLNVTRRRIKIFTKELSTAKEIVDKYVEDVLSGAIPAGIHLKNAVARFINDYKRCDSGGEAEANGWEFREDAFNKVVQFIHKLKHFTGETSKKHFDLEPWQMFIVANLYGFYINGSRRFQTAYMEMARKNGKTALVAALALYHLLEDGEDGGEILFTANSLEQAGIGFRMVSGFALSFDPEEKIIKHRFKNLHHEKSLSFIKVLAADSSKLDGYNCSLGIVDEYHEAPTSRVRDVLRSSMGMRTNPLLPTITTAGFDKTLPCYDLRTMTVDILSGNKKDDSFFGIIFTIDEEDDWTDPKVWVKSNPNLGVTVKASFIEKQVLQAKNNPSDEVGVKTKNLNIWCDSAEVWIPDQYIIGATDKIYLEDFRDMECYSGTDLSSNVDLSASAFLFVKDDIYYFFVDYYIPRDTLHSRVHADIELYKEWAAKKYLTVTAGNVTDYDYITHDILRVAELADIRLIFYDKYNATKWAIQCQEEGLPVAEFSQTIGNFNSATKEFERLMLGGKVVIDTNPINRYCLRNVVLRRDLNGNVKPSKENDKKKIDGVIAMLQALAAYMKETSSYKGTQIF
jgi:phage terminase large subunit-like protein